MSEPKRRSYSVLARVVTIIIVRKSALYTVEFLRSSSFSCHPPLFVPYRSGSPDRADHVPVCASDISLVVVSRLPS